MLRLALLILPLLAAPAQAQWSPPRELGTGRVFAPRVAVAPAGASLFAWQRMDDEKTQSTSFWAHGRGRLASRVFDVAGPVAAGRRFAFAWTRDGQRRLYVRVGGARTHLDTGRRLVSPQIAANGRGDVAVAWFDDRGRSSDAVLVAVRRADGRFRRPMALARGRVRGVAVAVGARGEVLVAWDALGTVRARSWRGGRWSGTETIRSHEAFSARLRTAFVEGNAVIAWAAKFRSEGGDARDTFVQVATRPPGARRFTRAKLLARHDGPESDVRIDPLMGNLAWSTPDGIFVTYPEEPGGHVLPGVRTGPAGAQLEDHDGSVVWTYEGRVHADGTPISGPGAADADAATDPRTGATTVVWVQDGTVMTSTRG